MDPKRKAARAKWVAMKPGIRQRIQVIANERNLSNDQTAKAVTCKDEHLLQFAKRYNLSLDWLICGDLPGALADGTVAKRKAAVDRLKW
jgi:hypothetical protein